MSRSGDGQPNLVAPVSSVVEICVSTDDIMTEQGGDSACSGCWTL